MLKEVWKDVFKYEGIYKVSNLGNIKSLDRITININGVKRFRKSQIIKTRIGKDGNVRVNLNKDGVKSVHSLARVVYKAFNPDFNYYNNDLIVIHKNNKTIDNKLENLEVLNRNDYIIPNGEEYKREKRKVICITTGKKFESISDAERYYNTKVGFGSISKCCQGYKKSAGKIILDDGTVYKLVWRYLENCE